MTEKKKIINLGLPRTGTRSFHTLMKMNKFKSFHTFMDKGFAKIYPNAYFNFINDPNNKQNAVYKIIENHDVLNDLPWYSKEMSECLINKYKDDPNVLFVATTRNKTDWVRSIKEIIPFIKTDSEKSFHMQEYKGILVKKPVSDDDLMKYYDNHHERISKHCIMLNLDDTSSIINNLKLHLGLPDLNCSAYPKIL